MQKITPFLWFDGKAEEAFNFYAEVFGENAKITNVSYYGESVPDLAGKVLTVSISIFDQNFIALNGGPHYSFTPAVSFMVTCENQEEVDRYWDQLLVGGESMACGWLTDKYGVTWQITPRVLMELLQDEDPAKSQRVMSAMMQMVKLDIPTLERAAAGE